jgi:hypothetical protein
MPYLFFCIYFKGPSTNSFNHFVIACYFVENSLILDYELKEGEYAYGHDIYDDGNSSWDLCMVFLLFFFDFLNIKCVFFFFCYHLMCICYPFFSDVSSCCSVSSNMRFRNPEESNLEYLLPNCYYSICENSDDDPSFICPPECVIVDDKCQQSKFYFLFLF